MGVQEGEMGGGNERVKDRSARTENIRVLSWEEHPPTGGLQGGRGGSP